jgi:HEAT repeat protein
MDGHKLFNWLIGLPLLLLLHSVANPQMVLPTRPPALISEYENVLPVFEEEMVQWGEQAPALEPPLTVPADVSGPLMEAWPVCLEPLLHKRSQPVEPAEPLLYAVRIDEEWYSVTSPAMIEEMPEFLREEDVEAEKEDTKAYKKAYQLVLEEKWNVAYEALSQFVQTYPESKWVDDAEFWQCYVLEKMGAPLEKVFNKYRAFAEKYTKSKWNDDAKAALIRIGERLIRQGKKEYTAFVQTLKSSADEEVRLAALFALRNVESEKAVDMAIRLYEKTENKRRKTTILYTIAQLHPVEKVIAFLEKVALTDTSEYLQKRAVNALATIQKPESTSALLRILKNSPSPRVKRMAILGLRWREGPNVRSILRDIALNSEVKELAGAALSVLGADQSKEATEILLEVLRHGKSRWARRQAIFLLVNRDAENTSRILHDIVMNEKDRQLRITALNALAQLSTGKAIATFRKIIEETEDPQLRQAALSGIARTNSDEAKAYLMDLAIRSPDERMAVKAAQALVNFRDGLNTSEIRKILKETRYVKVKRAILYELNILAVEQKIEIIRDVLKSETDAEVRKAAVRALGFDGGNEAVDLLVEVIETDPHVEVRTAAVRSLAMIGTPEAQEALMKLLEKE